MFIVLVMKGKGTFSSADSGYVKLFKNVAEADKYVEEVTKDGKYWTYAEIVDDGEEIEFYPEFATKES